MHWSIRAFAAVLAVGVFVVAGTEVLSTANQQPTPNADQTNTADQRSRAFRIHNARPDLSPAEVTQRIEASDAAIAALEAEGTDDISEEIHTRLRDIEVTDEARLAFYEAHRDDIFGGRSYERARPTIDRLIRIRAVRSELERAQSQAAR